MLIKMKNIFNPVYRKEFLDGYSAGLNPTIELAEDKNEVLKSVFAKAKTMDRSKLKHSVTSYGNSKTKKILDPIYRHAH